MTFNLLSSKSDEWLTPEWIVKRIDSVAPIYFDPFDHPDSLTNAGHRCVKAHGLDGFAQDWETTMRLAPLRACTFMNPPYSILADCLEKAHDEASRGVPIAALVPFRSETAAFHNHVYPLDPALFVFRGRLRFLRDVEIEYAEVSARKASPARDRRLGQIEEAAYHGAKVIESDSATFPSCLLAYGDEEFKDRIRSAFDKPKEGRWLL